MFTFAFCPPTKAVLQNNQQQRNFRRIGRNFSNYSNYSNHSNTNNNNNNTITNNNDNDNNNTITNNNNNNDNNNNNTNNNNDNNNNDNDNITNNNNNNNNNQNQEQTPTQTQTNTHNLNNLRQNRQRTSITNPRPQTTNSNYLDTPFSKVLFISEFLTTVIVIMMSNRYSDFELKNHISKQFFKGLFAVIFVNFCLNSFAFYFTVFKPMLLLADVYKGKEVPVEKFRYMKENLDSFRMNVKFRKLVILYFFFVEKNFCILRIF